MGKHKEEDEVWGWDPPARLKPMTNRRSIKELADWAERYSKSLDSPVLLEAAQRLREMEGGIEGYVIDERVNARGQGRTIEFKTGPVRSWPDAAPALLIILPQGESDERS